MSALADVGIGVSPSEKACPRRRSVRVQKMMSGMPEKGGHLTFGHKFALAIGAGPITLPLVTTTVYIQMFLLDVARVLPMYATTIIVVARILDAVSDPTVGAMVNKTQEKGGSLRKWMLLSLPISLLSFFFLWYVPPSLEEPVMLFVYYLIIYTVLQMAFTLYSIPFCSLVMYQSTDQSERDAATSFRIVGEAIFAVLSLFVVRFAEMLTDSGSLENTQCDHNSSVAPDALNRYRQTFMMQGAVGSLIILITGLYCFFGSMENTDIHIDAKMGMWSSFKNAMTFRPYMLLAFAYLAGYVAVNITQGCLLLYFKYVIDKEQIFTVAMLALVVSGALSIPLWKLLIGKYGKRKVSFCAVAVTVPAFSMLSVITKDITTPYLIAFAVITGPGCACGFYIPWVLLPDVIDAYTVEFGQRNESIFYGFFVFLSKLAAGCVTGGTMLTLKILNYDATKCDQNDYVNLALRVICAACPTCLLLLFGIVMYFFPLNEAKMEENRKYLQRKFFSHGATANNTQGNNGNEDNTSLNIVSSGRNSVTNNSITHNRGRSSSTDFESKDLTDQISPNRTPNNFHRNAQLPVLNSSELQFEYQKSPENTGGSLTNVPENETAEKFPDPERNSFKNSNRNGSSIDCVNGKDSSNGNVFYENEKSATKGKDGSTKSISKEASAKSASKDGIKVTFPSQQFSAHNAGSPSNNNSHNTNVPAHYNFPPVRRKDYELLTVRHSLPSISPASNELKNSSKFQHPNDRRTSGGHFRRISHSGHTHNSNSNAALKHKRVVSDYASRA